MVFPFLLVPGRRGDARIEFDVLLQSVLGLEVRKILLDLGRALKNNEQQRAANAIWAHLLCIERRPRWIRLKRVRVNMGWYVAGTLDDDFLSLGIRIRIGTV